MLLLGLSASAQKQQKNERPENTPEARAKREQARGEVQKGRAEKKLKMEEARRSAREKVARDTAKTTTSK